MRHRASRPLIDLWHRLPRTAARLLGNVATRGPVSALVALMVVLGLGTGAYVTLVIGASTTPTAESADLGERPGLPVSRDGERPDLTPEMPATDGRTPDGSRSGPRTPDAQSEAASPSTGVTPSERSRPGQTTGSPSPGTAAPSPSPSQPNETSTPEDGTPPNTSLSEEYPAEDSAQFSFSANESASFSCSLDGAAFTSCASPTVYSDLAPGWHTFAVRATDAAGNVDPSPAEARWLATKGRSGGE
jgi:hypothetical protein